MMSENKKKSNPIDIYVGTRIRLRRNMIGLSQERLGESLGITFQQVQKYEKGANRVGASRLQAISEILNVPVSFFFEGAPACEGSIGEGFAEPGPASFLMEFCRSSEGLQLNRAFAAISDPKTRRLIVDLIKTLGSSEGHGMSDKDLSSLCSLDMKEASR